jgi:hypothetical protein
MRPLPPSPPSEENSADSQIPRDYGIPEADFNWPWYRERQERQEQERRRLENEEKDKDNALYRVTLCFAILCFLTLYLLAYVFLSH